MLAWSHRNCFTVHYTHKCALEFARHHLYLSSNVASELHSCLVVIVDGVLLCQQPVKTDAIGRDY